MKQRENLLRLKRFRIGELKRQMTTLAGMGGGVERKLADLEESVLRERQRANDSDIGRLAFPSFLRAMDSRRENLRATLVELERERTQTELELDRVSEELKVLELATEQETRRGAEAELRKTRVRLDDLSMSRHLRKQALTSSS